MVGRVESAVETSGTSEKQINKLVTLKDLNGVVQVLLVDDHAMVRQGLRAILESYPDLHVVGEAADGRAGIEAVRTLRPHVVLMDVNMPVMDGIKATACIKQEYPNTVVVGLSVNADDNREAMTNAGAVDLLPKEAAVEQLHESIVRGLKVPLPSNSKETVIGSA
jgi:DNA-binding NarL/FixJ family response regulator